MRKKMIPNYDLIPFKRIGSFTIIFDGANILLFNDLIN